jgi:hypothetical protein
VVNPVVERWGSLSATGVAREATFGTPLTPTSFIPCTGNELQLDVGLFSPHVMFGQKDLNTFPLYGQYKMSGSVTAPAWPTNGATLISASIGPDASAGYGVAAPTPVTNTATTLNGAVSAGATTVTVTSGTGFATGQQIAIDTGGLLEIRKISNVVSNTITLADPLTFAHATGVAAVTGAPTTTLNGATIAGATTAVVTSAVGISINTIIQIDVNSPAGTTTSEIRKVTAISTNTLTLDVALTYAHGNAANVWIVAAPYFHNIQQANTLGSLTVEKDLGSYESLQFAGCRVNKLGISMAATNTEGTLTADLMAKSVAVLTAGSTSPIAITNESPWVFAESTVTLFGQAVQQAINVELSIENGVKDTYTMNSSHNPQFLTPVTRAITGKIDVVFTSLDDVTWGYYSQMVAGTSGSLLTTFVHPSSGGTMTFYMPKVVLAKTPDAVKMEDIITTSLEFTAFLNIPTLQTISAYILNTSYLQI